MKHSHRHKHKRNAKDGFTIIEILIVLAIAGLIMMILFLAVPALQRSARNTQRRHLVGMAAAQMDEYFASHGASYPNDPATMCTFIKNLELQTGTQKACSPSFAGGKSCVLVIGTKYDTCYHNLNSSHAYFGPEDEVSIQLGHWCNQGGGYNSAEAGSPITAGVGGGAPPHELRRYAVWTRLEGTRDPFCIDNYAN